MFRTHTPTRGRLTRAHRAGILGRIAIARSDGVTASHSSSRERMMLRSLTALTLALAFVAGAEAQAQRRLTGRVTAQDTGEPLAGASITAVGRPLGTVAGDAGSFSRSVP